MRATKPEDLIEIFDRILVYVYGVRYARDNPHISDKATAKLWAGMGCDAMIASIVLYDRMNAMHERHLRAKEKEDRTNVPCTMKLFTENIEAALRRQSGDVPDGADLAYSQWRSRVRAGKQTRICGVPTIGDRRHSMLVAEFRNRSWPNSYRIFIPPALPSPIPQHNKSTNGALS